MKFIELQMLREMPTKDGDDGLEFDPNGDYDGLPPALLDGLDYIKNG